MYEERTYTTVKCEQNTLREETLARSLHIIKETQYYTTLVYL